MDARLLHFYSVELQHLRQSAGEFAREYPKIAGRLGLDPDGKEACPDPFVERLLEGFAFLAARVHLKLDAEFPRFTQSLIETVYPDYLAPIPSMAVVSFSPDFNDKALGDGFVIPRGTLLRTAVGRTGQTPTVYRTAHEVKMWPLDLRAARYNVRNVAALELPPEAQAPATIQFDFAVTAGMKASETKLDRLAFFLRGSDELPSAVLHQILVHHVNVWVRSPDVPQAPWSCLPVGSIRPVGLADDEGLLPQNPATYSGYRLLTEYFAFPQRFLFFEIHGLREAVARCHGKRFQMVITLDQSEPELENHVDATTFDLYCTPVVNLFEKRADRINLSDRSAEFQVVVDRTKPLDYEVHTVLSVAGYRAGSPEEQTFLPFYLAQDSDDGGDAFFTVNRVQRLPSEREKRFGQLSSYGGSEVFLSLVDAACAPYPGRLEQLGVSTLCTNRHLPISVGRQDGTRDLLVEMNGPVRAARCIAGPTPPRESFARGDTAWRIISHLSLNYSSIIDAPGQSGASMLRGLLELYCAPHDRHFTKQISGIDSVTSVPILRRMPVPGMIHFGRGIEVTVLFDEDAFVGTGVFLLGMVLDHFFARIASINSFVETVIRTKQRGELTRWPARIGTKHIL